MSVLSTQVSDGSAVLARTGEVVSVEEADRMEDEFFKEGQALRAQVSKDNEWMLDPELIYENERLLYYTLMSHFQTCMKQWLSLLAENATGSQSKKWTYEDMMKDLERSLTLDRLLHGKPFIASPIKSYGNPWYTLEDEGEDICIDVYFNSTGYNTKLKPTVSIDGESWEIEQEVEPDLIYLVSPRYMKGNEDRVFVLSKMSAEELAAKPSKLRSKLSDWKLSKLDGSSYESGK